MKEVVTVALCKALEEEKRRAFFLVLSPDTPDEHGDVFPSEVIEKACEDFNKNMERVNIFHTIDLDEGQAVITQSYIAPSDFEVGTTLVKAGSWVQWWGFPETEAGSLLWDWVKSGEINGVSIKCSAMVEEV